MSSQLRKLPAQEFALPLYQSSKRGHHFAFFIGAGCSRSSGIPTASELVEIEWLPRLRRLTEPQFGDQEVRQWAKIRFPDRDTEELAALYGPVMEQLFLHPEERQDEIERLCEGHNPRFGYATLASLVAQESGCFNVVLTTNFDDLIADALYLFTRSRPLVIQHAALSKYIRPTRSRPLLIKIHGDYQLAPLNTADETQKLADSFERALQSLLHDRGLIFMGYGGGDRGILRMLQSLPSEALPYGVYWVSRSEPKGAAWDWLISRNAVWVEYDDFDKFMVLVRSEFGLPQPDEQRFREIFRRYADDYKGLAQAIGGLSSAIPAESALKEAVKQTDATFEGPWSALMAATRLMRIDPDAAEAIFQRGIAEFTESPELLREYALFFETQRRDHDRAEEFFRQAIAADPNHAYSLESYANFLAYRRGDAKQAEEYYQRAVAAEPNDAFFLARYAVFLQTQRRDYDRADDFFQRAIAADPNHAYSLASYAAFLANQRRDYDGAETLYQRAVLADPNDPSALVGYAEFLDNRREHDRADQLYERAVAADPGYADSLVGYANFLADRRHDDDLADDFFQRAIAANPSDAFSLASYANFVADHRREEPDWAEELYKRAVAAAGPNDVFGLTNYANFLADRRRDRVGAQALYERAIAADPNDATSLSSFAGFLASPRGDLDRANTLYLRALAVDPNDAFILTNYARFLAEQRGDPDRAETEFRGAIAADPDLPYCLTSYARFLAGQRGDHDRAEDFFEQAIKVDPNDAFSLSWFAIFVDTERQDYVRAERLYERAIAADPHDVKTLGSYAAFLDENRDDPDLAEDLFRLALDADPDDANNLGNFARHLFVQGWRDEAMDELTRALALVSQGEDDVLLSELRFYAYAHGPMADRKTGLCDLRRLLEAGVRSAGWDMSRNAHRACQDGHDECAWLDMLANVISGAADIDSLADWQAWQDACDPTQ